MSNDNNQSGTNIQTNSDKAEEYGFEEILAELGESAHQCNACASWPLPAGEVFCTFCMMGIVDYLRSIEFPNGI